MLEPPMLSKLFASREKKLGEAIANGELGKMKQLLDLGVRQIDYLRMKPADFGTGKEMVPMRAYSDPVQLASDIGLNDQGMRLLQSYGLGDGPVPKRKEYR